MIIINLWCAKFYIMILAKIILIICCSLQMYIFQSLAVENEVNLRFQNFTKVIEIIDGGLQFDLALALDERLLNELPI